MYRKAIRVKNINIVLGKILEKLKEVKGKFENDNKIYEWKIALDKNGRPAPVRIDNYYEECVYDDLNYIYFTSY